MPVSKDNDEERFARIEALCEEYRIKHEDLAAYVAAVRNNNLELRAETKKRMAKAIRERVAKGKQGRVR